METVQWLPLTFRISHIHKRVIFGYFYVTNWNVAKSYTVKQQIWRSFVHEHIFLSAKMRTIHVLNSIWRTVWRCNFKRGENCGYLWIRASTETVCSPSVPSSTFPTFLSKSFRSLGFMVQRGKEVWICLVGVLCWSPLQDISFIKGDRLFAV